MIPCSSKVAEISALASGDFKYRWCKRHRDQSNPGVTPPNNTSPSEIISQFVGLKIIATARAHKYISSSNCSGTYFHGWRMSQAN
ncbi:MAG: hypothetical protein ACREBW_01330 [Candidatus Micrarchaeaceae archaeon]